MEQNKIPWINAAHRTPVYHRSYFCKVNGIKQVLRWDELERLVSRAADEVFWLEEPEDIFVPATPKQEYVFKKFDAPPPEIKTAPIKAPTKKRSPRRTAKVEAKAAPVPESLDALVERHHILAAALTQCGGERFPFRAKNTTLIGKSLMAIEFGEYKYPTTPYGQHSPNCPIPRDDKFGAFKFRVKNSIMLAIQYDFELETILAMEEFKLINITKIFPMLKLQCDVPTDLIPQLLWIYGLTGFRIIKRKLFLSYTNRLCNNEQHKQAMKKAS